MMLVVKWLWVRGVLVKVRRVVDDAESRFAVTIQGHCELFAHRNLPDPHLCMNISSKALLYIKEELKNDVIFV
jgi:hypothetical protein